MTNELTNDNSMSPMEIAEEVMKLEKLKKQVDAKLKDHKANLLEVMTDLDVLSLKTGSYTLSRKSYNRIRVIDDQEVAKSLEKMGVPVETKEVLDMDYMKIPIKQILDKGEIIGGIEEIRTPYVTVRLATKKDAK